LAQRSMEKCIRIVDHYMKKVGAQKITIPNLTSIDLWKKSGRYVANNAELLTTTDRHDKVYILGPTYEEAVTSLMVNIGPISYRHFPLRLYQIGNKFREEQRPKFGLLRAKEFLMKDSYSFDIDRPNAIRTYEDYVQVYKDLFEAIGVRVLTVQADAGNIGGSLSHEYQIPTEIGEDTLVQCEKCNWYANVEFSGDVSSCPKCESKIQRSRAIEVGHTFLLEDKYSKPLQATYLHQNGKPATLMMGCYGIGISRLIAASIETLSTEDQIRWPFVLAPFSVCIIPPKGGSREEPSVSHLTDLIYTELTKINELNDDVIVDDRLGLTIGKRLLEAKRMGYPMIIVVGREAAGDNGKYELHFTNPESVLQLSLNELLLEVHKKTNLHRYR